MTGLLAQTNATIREAERRQREARDRESQLRRPVRLIDQLLQELEELNLKGMKRVPMAYEPRLDEIVSLVAPTPTVVNHLSNVKVKVAIPKLMDALYAIEEAVFEERLGPAILSDEDTFPSDLFTAA
ncbi:MAG TPA: hypothetical protein VLS53_04270 [Candidatus Dormibacteraeota bacterium]|nr:hypothetical protein [Candidatus Dormibacteraeota bacterium]